MSMQPMGSVQGCLIRTLNICLLRVSGLDISRSIFPLISISIASLSLTKEISITSCALSFYSLIFLSRYSFKAEALLNLSSFAP